MRGQIRNNGIIGKLQDVHVIPRVSTFRGSIGKNPVCFTNIESMALLIALSEFPYGMGGDFDNCEWEMGAQGPVKHICVVIGLSTFRNTKQQY